MNQNYRDRNSNTTTVTQQRPTNIHGWNSSSDIRNESRKKGGGKKGTEKGKINVRSEGSPVYSLIVTLIVLQRSPSVLFVSFLISQSPNTVSLYNIYVSRISQVGWKGLVLFLDPSGIPEDNWTNLTKPSEYTHSSVLQNIGQYRYQLSTWQIDGAEVSKKLPTSRPVVYTKTFKTTDPTKRGCIACVRNVTNSPSLKRMTLEWGSTVFGTG